MNSATATMQTRSVLQSGAAVVIFLAGLCASAVTASAQSILEGKSPGMRDCVQTILNGQGLVKKINVHGHRFICRRMSAASRPRGNFRQILLERSRFGLDDAYVVNFRVDAQNAIVPGTLRIRTTNGLSTKRLLTDWKGSILATNSAMAFFAAHYYNQIRDFEGPSAYRSLTYTQVRDLARAVPLVETKTWETAAFQITLIAMAEHGRSAARQPVFATRATQLQR